MTSTSNLVSLHEYRRFKRTESIKRFMTSPYMPLAVGLVALLAFGIYNNYMLWETNSPIISFYE